MTMIRSNVYTTSAGTLPKALWNINQGQRHSRDCNTIINNRVSRYTTLIHKDKNARLRLVKMR